MNGKSSRTAIATALVVALVAPAIRAEEGEATRDAPRNRIAAVRIEREATRTLVRIEGDRAPVFSVYTLHDPLRLVIDFSQGDVSALETPIDVDDGVLTKIVAAQYGEGPRAVGRVILGFVRRVPYDVRADGNALVVRLAAVGKQRPTLAALAAKEAEVRDREKRLAAKAAELEKARAEVVAKAREAQAAREAAEAERKAREALEARAREAEAARAAAEAEAEKRARAALEEKAREAEAARVSAEKALERAKAEREAREAEAARRKELEEKLRQAERALAAERDAVKRARDELAEAREKAGQDRERGLREKEAELRAVKEALEARTAEVESTRRAAAEAERRAKEATAARDAEVARRRSIEAQLEQARGLLAEERQAARKAESDLEAMRKELAGAAGARRALERARAEAAAAARELASLREKVRAASDDKEKRRLAERLAAAEKRARDLDALRSRVEGSGSPAAAARELLAHKNAEIEGLKARLAAAERVVQATAEELARVRRTEAERRRVAEQARQRAEEEARRARAALASSTASVAGEGGARIALAAGGATQAAPVVVRDVGYRSNGGRSSVVLRFDGEPRYVLHRKGQKRLVLDLPGAKLPAHLRRTLDVSAFDGPVAMVSAYESGRPVKTTRVTVDLRSPASYEVTRDGADLRLDLKGIASPTAAPDSTAAAAKPAVLVARAPAAASAAKDEEPEVLERKPPPPAARPRPAKKKRTYRGRRINLDLQDAEIHTVLKLISEVIRLNFVVSDDVKGKVTMTLRDVPWDQALEIILKSKGIGFVREGNIIRVAPEKVLAKEAEAETKRAVAVKEAQPILLKIIPVNYAKAADLSPRVKDVLSEKGAVSVDVRTNRLIVRDVMERIRAAERMVKKLDTQTPQVLIEARIVEANTTFSREIGIQWGGDITLSPATGNPTGLVFPSTIGIAGGAPLGLAPAQGILNPTAPHFAVNLPALTGQNAGGAVGFTFGSIGGTVNLNLRLSAAEENGQAKIISAPKITTLDNQKATIQQGVSIPISQSSALGVNTIFVDANLTLTVTPHVTLDGSVIMDIVATKNEPDFQRTGALGDPTIVRKEARTQVLIRDGDTTVIGGIYTRNQTTNFREVPLLAKIPILGWLFKKRLETDNRTELLIFITPRIVNRPESMGT